MSRIAVVALALWAATIAIAAYFFIYGTTVTASDGREMVLLTAAERDAVLGEMRGMLEAVANITGALATGDTAAIAKIARPVGTAAMNGEPPTVLAKLPLDMKTAGLAAHQGFDAIADAATAGAAAQTLTGMLADQLTACTSCHALYRLGP
jgi:hypothetical protein